MKNFLQSRNKGQKFAIYAIIIVILIGAGMYWWQNYGPYDITTPEDEITSIKEYERYTRSLQKAWQNDTVGFDTPEKTFNAFRESLKEGDYELASSYFIPQKQEEMLETFTISAERGYVDKLLEDLYLNNKKISLSENKVRFRTDDKGSEYNFSYDLILNSYNGIWKMYEL